LPLTSISPRYSLRGGGGEAHAEVIHPAIQRVVASEILRQLWEHAARMKDCPRLSCNLPAIFGLQRTAEEIERLCKRLSQVIHAEESRTDV
jgi:hypothetical protein